MDEILIFRSNTNARFVVGIGVVAMGVGLWFLLSGNLAGWLFVCFGLGLIVVGILGLRDRKTRITLSSQGLKVRELGDEPIPWGMIKSVKTQWLPRSGNLMVLTLHNEEKMRFFISGLAISEKELLELIQERIISI